MAKITDFPAGTKIRKPHWNKNSYVFYRAGYWIDEEGNNEHTTKYHIYEDDWEEYKEKTEESEIINVTVYTVCPNCRGKLQITLKSLGEYL